MAKFEKKTRDSGRDRPKRPRTGSAKAGEEKKDGYKAKRSFTKNKGLREKQKDGGYDREKRGFGGRSDRPSRSFGSKGDRPSFRDGQNTDRGLKRPERGEADARPRRSAAEGEGRESRPYRKESSERPRRTEGGDRPFRKPEGDRPFRQRSEGDEKPRRAEGGDRPFRKSEGDRPFRSRPAGFEKPRRSSSERPERSSRDGEEAPQRRVKYEDFEEGRTFKRNSEEKAPRGPSPVKKKNDDGLVRLNKYLSNAGVSSRREADLLIQGGTVKVNGVVVDQLGYKIKPTDVVTYGDSAVKSERKVYLLLNKPKDYITTVDDPRERKTVMELVQGACKERIYPVGRLDRNTTGLLLFTNDGELTTKLTHPKHGVKKIYHVTLNKGLRADDFKSIVDGIELEDGIIHVDDVAFVGEGKKDIGIEIHSGRNRIVRRIFEHLGYDVLKLDRVVFAGLTKKDLPRGKHRFLTAKEISFLQMIG